MPRGEWRADMVDARSLPIPCELLGHRERGGVVPGGSGCVRGSRLTLKMLPMASNLGCQRVRSKADSAAKPRA